MKSDILTESSIKTQLFGQRSELLPSVTELFELDMAYLEQKILGEQALIERSAYFKTVNGKPTKHYLQCSRNAKTMQGRSAVAKAYFQEGQFSTGYATHGLFPYRGKFHPQIIRGIFNVLGIKEKETILDPMCGNGTANIEAALMGINSIAVDISPFCRIMTKAKYDSLTVDKETILKLKAKPEQLFDFFIKGNISQRVAKLNSPEKFVKLRTMLQNWFI